MTDAKKNTTPNDWIIARTHHEETFPRIAKMICDYGNYFKIEADKFNLKVLNTDKYFDEKIVEAIEMLGNN